MTHTLHVRRADSARGAQDKDAGPIAVTHIYTPTHLYTHTHINTHVKHMYGAQIVLEVRKTKMLDQQLSHVNDALGTTRDLMGGINTAKEQSVSVQVRHAVVCLRACVCVHLSRCNTCACVLASTDVTWDMACLCMCKRAAFCDKRLQ